MQRFENDYEKAMPEAERVKVLKEDNYENPDLVVRGSKRLAGPPGFSYSPFEGFVSSLAPFWSTSLKFLKELYHTAPFSQLCNAALGINAMKGGQWVLLGLGDGGETATGPRPEWSGVDLLKGYGYPGGPFPDDMKMEVFFGIAVSAVPELMRLGLRGSLRPGDRARQLSFDPDRKPVRVAYASRSKECAMRYPWQMFVQGKRAGELCIADGTGPLCACVQATLILRDGNGEPNIRWQYKKKTNDQVAFEPYWCCPTVLHLYGMDIAYRPYRATNFSEGSVLQANTMGKFSLQADMAWPEHEYKRRLRQAERMIAAADLPVGDFSSRPPRRLAPKRREPLRGNETQEEADRRAAFELADAYGASETEIAIFSDDEVELVSETDEETEGTRAAQATWWKTPEYCESRKRKRIEDARDAGASDARLRSLGEEERDEGARVLTGSQSEKGVAKEKTPEGRVSQVKRPKQVATHKEEEEPYPPVAAMTIDEKDPSQWQECAGRCGFFNVGTRGTNYCCTACSKKPGTHGAMCKRRSLADGRSLAPETRSGQCQHGNDPNVCSRCGKRGMAPTGEMWVTDLCHFLVVSEEQHYNPLPFMQPRFHMANPERTGYTVSDSSMQRMVDSPEPRLYQVTETRQVWVFAVPGATILPEANQWDVSTWAVFWRMFGGYTGKVAFYVVPQRESVLGSWGSAQRDRRAMAILDSCGGGISVLPTVKEVLESLGLAPEKVFVTDYMHMTREASKAVHKWYWECIQADLDRVGKPQHVPVMCWDFNVSSKHLKEEYQKHVQFWNLVARWGEETAEEKPPLVKEVNQLIYCENRLQPQWYKSSRKEIIDYKDADKQRHSLDESHLPEHDESDDCWCPGWLPGNAYTENGIVASRTMAEKDAAEGDWPDNKQVKRWLKCFGLLLRQVEGKISHDEVLKSFNSAGGDYRMWFAAAARKYKVKNVHALTREIEEEEI